jgi:hypothetical protein
MWTAMCTATMCKVSQTQYMLKTDGIARYPVSLLTGDAP